MPQRRPTDSRYPTGPQQAAVSPYEVQYIPQYDPGVQQMMSQALGQRQQRYDQSVDMISESAAQFGQVPNISGQEVSEHVGMFTEELHNIANEYGGDYGMARAALSRRIAQEAGNPFYQTAERQAQQAEIAQQAQLQYGADALVVNDPRQHSIQDIMENPELGYAEVYQAPDYVGVGREVMGKIQADMIDEGLSITEWGDAIGQALTTGSVAEIDNEDVRRVAEAGLEAFKAATANRIYDDREGFEWVHSDEEILEFLANLAEGQITRQERFQHQPLETEGGGFDPSIHTRPSSGAEVKADAIIQALPLPPHQGNLIDSVDSLNEAVSDPTYIHREEALRMREGLRAEVFEMGAVESPTEGLNDLAYSVLPNLEIWEKLTPVERQNLQSHLLSFEDNYGGQSVQEYLRDWLLENKPEIGIDRAVTEHRTAGGLASTPTRSVASEHFRKVGKEYDKWNKRIDREVDKRIKRHKTEVSKRRLIKHEDKLVMRDLVESLVGLGQEYDGRVKATDQRNRVNSDIAKDIVTDFMQDPKKFSITMDQGTATIPPKIKITRLDQRAYGKNNVSATLEFQGRLERVASDWRELAVGLNNIGIYHEGLTHLIGTRVAEFSPSRVEEIVSQDTSISTPASLLDRADTYDDSDQRGINNFVVSIAELVGSGTPELHNLFIIKDDNNYKVVQFDDNWNPSPIEVDGLGLLETSSPNDVGALVDSVALLFGGYDNPSFTYRAAAHNFNETASNSQKNKFWANMMARFQL